MRGHAFQASLYTAICMAIFLCGAYPTISKSSKVKESMSVLAGLIRRVCNTTKRNVKTLDSFNSKGRYGSLSIHGHNAPF